MVTTNFLVKKRKISQLDSVPFTGEYNIDTFKFEFDDEWDGLNKTLVIVADETYNVSLLNDECIVPMEFYNKKGNIVIGLFGTNGTETILATGLLTIHIEDDAYRLGQEPSNLPTPTQWDLYVEEINRLLDECEASEDNCNSIKIQLEEEVAEIERKLEEGEFDGRGIVDIVKISTVGLVDTYQINYTDGTTSTYQVTNGSNGEAGTRNYEDLTNKPKINNVELKGNKTLSDLGIPTKTSSLTNDSGFITNTVNNLQNYTLKTRTGSLIDLEINGTTYVVTLKLKNQDGTVISTDTIDLPLESVVVNGRYDNNTKKVILTLENGSEIDFSVADLVAGLQTEITSNNKIASDLVDDSNSGNKFVTTTEKNSWNGKYEKPSGGIPYNDLEQSVKESLNKADTALQAHQDISGKEDKTNKTNTIDNNSTNVQYPSAKAVYDELVIKQDEIEKLQNDIEMLEENFNTENIVIEGQDKIENALSWNVDKFNSFGAKEIEQNTTEGKNLLDVANANMTNVGLDSANGILATSTLFTRLGSMNYIPLRAGTYSLSYKNLNSSWVWAYDANKNYLGNGYITSSWVNNSSQSFTLENDGYVRIILRYVNNSDIDITKDYEIQIEPGSTATSYEPYTGGQSSPNPDYPQDIKVVEGECDVKVSNKNLVDVEFEMGGYSGAGNKYSSTTRIRSKEDINLDAGTYTISSNEATSIAVYKVKDSQEVYLSSNSLTFTLTQNSNVRITIETPLLLDSEVQLELGTTVTSYVPHKEQNYSITLPEGMFLGSLGTASNYIYGTKDNWKLVNGLAKTTDTSGSTSITISDMKSNGGFKSYYGGTLSGTTITYDSAIGGTNTIYYEKASSTETDITDATLISQLNNIAENLQTYKEVTNIIITGGDIKAKLDMDYYLDDRTAIYDYVDSQITDAMGGSY